LPWSKYKLLQNGNSKPSAWFFRLYFMLFVKPIPTGFVFLVKRSNGSLEWKNSQQDEHFLKAKQMERLGRSWGKRRKKLSEGQVTLSVDSS
jgi:hypothetical protein